MAINELWISRNGNETVEGIEYVGELEGNIADTGPAAGDLITDYWAAWSDANFQTPEAIRIESIPHATKLKARWRVTWRGNRIWS